MPSQLFTNNYLQLEHVISYISNIELCTNYALFVQEVKQDVHYKVNSYTANAVKVKYYRGDTVKVKYYKNDIVHSALRQCIRDNQ